MNRELAIAVHVDDDGLKLWGHVVVGVHQMSVRVKNAIEASGEAPRSILIFTVLTDASNTTTNNSTQG